jgi:hypothetical protein
MPIPFPSVFKQKYLPLVEPKSNRILGLCQLPAITNINETVAFQYAGLSFVPKRHKSPVAQDGKKVDVEYLCLEISQTMARDGSYVHDSKYVSLADVPNSARHSSGSHQPNVLLITEGPLLEFLRTAVITTPAV